jgi:uncharacterized protein (UPF0332 family)
MTTDNRKANAGDEARRGEECLAEAKYLLAGGFHNAAVSRAYYAAFHWALALPLLKGLEPRSRRGCIQLLQLHYVETGLLEAAAASALSQPETYRELSDYNAKASFDVSRAAAEVQRAESFIASCRPFLG